MAKKMGNNIESATVSDNLWTANNHEWKTLYTSAYQNAIFKRKEKINASVKDNKKRTANTYVVFQVSAPKLETNHRVCLLGSRKEIGEWNKENVIPMNYIGGSVWEKEIKLNKNDSILHFKYGIYDSKNKELITLEHGEDRHIYNVDFMPTVTNIVKVKSNFKYSTNEVHAAGVAIPVFSLRSNKGMGVGEFSDINFLVDWCTKTGIKMIQLLPVNDTVHTQTWVDSYPYSAISSFALHPIYLDIEAIGNLPKDMSAKILKAETDRLNKNEMIDYDEVMRVKSIFYKKAFDANKEKFSKDKEFKKFFKENEEWLVPYAAYSYLRDKFNTHDYRNWGLYKNYNKELIDKLVAPKSDIFDDIAVHYFIQFHLDKQLLKAADYARENGVILKGDIPIGVNKYGADTWVNPELFNMDSQTGAPPDDYAEDGQNWGFPTYNWDEMAKDNYLWWQKRFQKIAEYFDAYRIDHILGFFRIWEIPNNAVSGLLGYFSPATPVTQDELNWLNIGFDEDRFCKPYIRDYIYYRYGNEDAELLKSKYLDQYAPGCYNLKEEYNTQEKIKNSLLVDDTSEGEKENILRIKKILMKLVTEVLLIKDKNRPNCYHPRIAANKTSSFADLDENCRNKFYDMYIDYFYKRQENLWREEAYKKLPALINSTNMMVCGEDLGMVPDCVPEVMDDLGLLSLKIQRMPKETELDFGIPSQYPYMSVCTPSCHDMSTIRGWWEEDGKKRQKFYNDYLGHGGEAPIFCEPWICEQMILQHLYSPSMWAVFPIQDLLATDGTLRRENPSDEKINEPSIIPHYWRYRFHMPMENLLEEDSFNNHILEMVNSSERNSVVY
jgi:4-alpha-glucanotransferase